MNNSLPNDLFHYVYEHVDPRTGELLYVGHGSRGRAWTHGSDKTVLRSQEHLAHLESMTQDGFVASEWVNILIQGISKSDACLKEQELIRQLKPLYNKPQGKKALKLTPEQYTLCLQMRQDGLFYYQIADEMGVSTMTIYRALNNQTKNIGDDYAE